MAASPEELLSFDLLVHLYKVYKLVTRTFQIQHRLELLSRSLERIAQFRKGISLLLFNCFQSLHGKLFTGLLLWIGSEQEFTASCKLCSLMDAIHASLTALHLFGAQSVELVFLVREGENVLIDLFDSKNQRHHRIMTLLLK